MLICRVEIVLGFSVIIFVIWLLGYLRLYLMLSSILINFLIDCYYPTLIKKFEIKDNNLRIYTHILLLFSKKLLMKNY